jgi:hypothetical protein
MDEVEIEIAKKCVNRAMATGRYSSGFFRELCADQANFNRIVEELSKLEGVNREPSRTKRAEQFSRDPLRGLWRKHHQESRIRSITENILNHIRQPGWLDRATIRSSRRSSPEEAITDLSRRVVEGYFHRSSAGQLTGEWIVYAKQDGKAYYLTLGSHTEGDEAIWRRCKACAAEFPELLILQDNREGSGRDPARSI